MPTPRELKSLARQYLQDATILKNSGRYDGAVYMCGYVLETALKACVCRHLKLGQYPPPGFDKPLFKTHEFEHLCVLAGLGDKFPQGASSQMQANWSLVSGWAPEWRYRPPGTVRLHEAEAMIRALADKPNGILTWLKKRW